MSGPEPSAELRAGRRGLTGVTGLRLVEDFRWLAQRDRFLLRCVLRLDEVPEGAVPQETAWVIEVEPSYPFGEIIFWPDQEGGLTETFPHQADNVALDGVPFRRGRVCLTQNYTASRGRPDETEPYDADGRLRWHAEQALCWLRAASRGDLTGAGANFLLPGRVVQVLLCVSYEAGADDLPIWLARPDRVGMAVLRSSVISPWTWLIDRWSTLGREQDVQPATWGDALLARSSEVVGLWVRLDRVPHVSPWRMPRCWGELMRACHEQGVDLAQLLRLGLGRYKRGRHATLRMPLLLGYPIPERFGDAPVSMYWDVLWLAIHGHNIPGEQEPLSWGVTANWHPDQIGARGRLPREVRGRTYLLIGAGALGSAVGEMLVRGGVGRVLIQDPDPLHAGNLTRHTGLLPDLGMPKAEVLAERLALATPHARATVVPGAFPPVQEDHRRMLDEVQVVLDTTGDDGLINALGAHPWDVDRIFISLSLGRGARRLFCFFYRGRSFPRDIFHGSLSPHLLRERSEEGGTRRAGAGCQDPFFPARIDDVWLLATLAVKQIAAWLEDPPDGPTLSVFEQDGRGGVARLDAKN